MLRRAQEGCKGLTSRIGTHDETEAIASNLAELSQCLRFLQGNKLRRTSCLELPPFAFLSGRLAPGQKTRRAQIATVLTKHSRRKTTRKPFATTRKKCLASSPRSSSWCCQYCLAQRKRPTRCLTLAVVRHATAPAVEDCARPSRCKSHWSSDLCPMLRKCPA